MKWIAAVNIRRFCVTLLLMVSVIFLTFGTSVAQIQSISIAVEGMSCPFCAYGVEKNLKQIEEIESVTINMKDSTAVLTIKKEKTIDIGRIQEAVKKTGFTPGTITISAIGSVTADENDNLSLQIQGFEGAIFLSELKSDVREKLLILAKSGSPAVISGIVREQRAGVWFLVPQSVEEASR